MHKIEKLLRRLNKKDRAQLIHISDLLKQDKTAGLNVTKLKGTDFYRIRHRRFRIIFHKESGSNDVVIDSVKLRRENTYKNL